MNQWIEKLHFIEQKRLSEKKQLNEKSRLDISRLKTNMLSLANIFFKIDERTKIFLWKGVKYFCSDVQNPSGIVPADFGHPRPIFNFFCLSKKVIFLWYTFDQNTHSLDNLKLTQITIVQGDFWIKFWIQYFVFPSFASMIVFFKSSRLSVFWQWRFVSILNHLDYEYFDQKYTT